MNALCLLNHQLTENQRDELKTTFGGEAIVYPPPETADLWAQLPTDDISAELLLPFTQWIDIYASSGMPIVIQGEAGAVTALVCYCLKLGLIPLHSVTRREATETRSGETVQRSYIFRHIRFRRYALIS